MTPNALRLRAGLLAVALSLAGCASYSGLNTEGRSLDAQNLKAGKSLSGVKASPASWPADDGWKSLGDAQLDSLIGATATQRYGSGIGNYLDVLTTEQQLLQSQRQLADLNAERIDLSIQLMQALGGGFRGDQSWTAAAPAPLSTASPTTR